LGLGKTLTIKGLSLLFVLFCVLFLTVIIIGATGVSDRILSAILSDRVRAFRQEMATKITDPEKLNEAVGPRYPASAWISRGTSVCQAWSGG